MDGFGVMTEAIVASGDAAVGVALMAFVAWSKHGRMSVRAWRCIMDWRILRKLLLPLLLDFMNC
jgi:hypothetical protein